MLEVPVGSNEVEVKSGQIKLICWYWYFRHTYRVFLISKNVCINTGPSVNKFY